MDEIISITKFAKMCNITTETLRYYDRIDLFKPDRVDEKTGMRYYSVHGYERIGTIKELQQLGLSLTDIRSYMEKRSIRASYEVLAKEKHVIKNRIEELKVLQKKVEDKLRYLDEAMEHGAGDEVIEHRFEQRYYLVGDECVTDEIGVSVQCAILEKQINSIEKYIPTFASDIFTGFVSLDDVAKGDYQKTEMAVRLTGEELIKQDIKNVKKVAGGDFLCKYYIGDFWFREKNIKEIMDYAKEHKYVLQDPIIVSVWIDMGVTDDQSEIGYVIQIPFGRTDQ